MVNLAKHKRLSLRLCDGVKVAAKHFHNYFSIRVFVETPSSLESFGRNTQFLVETWLRENPTLKDKSITNPMQQKAGYFAR